MQDHGIDALGGGKATIGGKLGLPVLDDRDQNVDLACFQAAAETGHEFGGVGVEAKPLSHDDADRAGPARGETGCGSVGMVAEFLGEPEDLLTGFELDFGIA